MPVKNVECQLAQAQLTRYLNGDPISAQAQAYLEEHLRDCPLCAAELRSRRESLKQILQISETVETPHPAPSAVPTNLIELLRAQEAASQPAPMVQAVVESPMPEMVEITPEPVTPSLTFWGRYGKPLLYGAGLCLVLAGMNTIAKDPTRYLGSRVTATIPAEAKVTTKPAAIPDEPLALEEFLPDAFRSVIEEFPGTPEAQDVTFDNTRRLIMETPAPAPEVTPAAPARTIRAERPRRNVRRAPRRTTTPRNVVRPSTGIQVYPPEN